MSQLQNPLPDCDTLRALIPAYCMGATDPDETALVEKLLPLCPEAAAELDEYRALSRAMLYAAPTVQPPAALHEELMAAVRAESAPAVPKIATPMPALRHPRATRLWIAAAGVAAALLIVSNVYWIAQVSRLNQQQQAMTALLQNQEDALTALGTGKANRVQLVSTSGASSEVLATVLWTPQSSTGLIYSSSLPPLAPDKTYQLWFIQDSHPVSAGIFQLDPLGVGVLIFQLAQPMSAYNAVAISTEPAGGSDQPTTTPIAAAQLG